MTEDVLITVTGLHAVNREKDAEDKVEITSAGKYYKKNGKHFVLYDEVAEETGTSSKTASNSQTARWRFTRRDR